MRSLDDAEIADLLTAVAGGSREAFKQLYDRTAPKLLGVILRMRHDRALAEDILQDVFLRVWQNAGNYSRETAPAMAWLVSIARHRTIDLLRRKTPELVGPDRDGADPMDRVPEPGDAAGRWMEAEGLRHCLERVDPDPRECIVLAYCEGWSREELAQRYGRPVNTIKTWLHRGLAVLRTCLDET